MAISTPDSLKFRLSYLIYHSYECCMNIVFHHKQMLLEEVFTVPFCRLFIFFQEIILFSEKEVQHGIGTQPSLFSSWQQYRQWWIQVYRPGGKFFGDNSTSLLCRACCNYTCFSSIIKQKMYATITAVNSNVFKNVSLDVTTGILRLL